MQLNPPDLPPPPPPPAPPEPNWLGMALADVGAMYAGQALGNIANQPPTGSGGVLHGYYDTTGPLGVDTALKVDPAFSVPGSVALSAPFERLGMAGMGTGGILDPAPLARPTISPLLTPLALPPAALAPTGTIAPAPVTPLPAPVAPLSTQRAAPMGGPPPLMGDHLTAAAGIRPPAGWFYDPARGVYVNSANPALTRTVEQMSAATGTASAMGAYP